MRHLTISEYGSFLGLAGERLVIKQKSETVSEIPLSRLRTISITKSGISISSDLIQACAVRGIRIIFLDWRNRIVSAVMGQNQHAVVALRKSQFETVKNDLLSCSLSKKVIISKIKNQHAVIMYFSKNLIKKFDKIKHITDNYNKSVSLILKDIINLVPSNNVNWRNTLLGFEGKAATVYWQTISDLNLLPQDFTTREKRNAQSITNKALNYGYAILLSYVWSAIDNAGLESYAGILHTDRPGKPSLVLDLMEEYRAWIVDRIIIKLRFQLEGLSSFDPKIKKMISNNIHQTMMTSYIYNKKKVKLENIIQRQVYKFAGSLAEQKNYKGYTFKW